MRLKTVTTGGTTTTYTYNGDGDRVAQTVGATTTTYVLDVGTPLTMVIAEMTGSSTIYYLHGLDLVAETDGTSVEYFAYDGLGSVRQILDSTGSPLLAQTFDPYGNSLSRTGIGQSAFGYTNEYTDATGLLYLRARYYDPSMGRFFQRDTWRGSNERPQSLNPYSYGLNNPVLHTDPSGHDPYWCETAPDPQKCYTDWLSNWLKASGYLTSIPLVNSNGSLRYLDDWYGSKNHRSEMQWLTASQRRDEAVRIASDLAGKPIGELGGLGYSTTPDSNGNCFDCTRFVSYVLWRVGFRMDPASPNSQLANGTPVYSADTAGWWANLTLAGGGNSAIWEQVIKFREYWLQHGAAVRPLNQLEKGDVIVYDYQNDGPEKDWDHVAMVVEPDRNPDPSLALPQVASRGNGGCGPGFENTPYSNVVDFNIQRVEGLHMPYER